MYNSQNGYSSIENTGKIKKRTIIHLENGVGTENGGIFKSQSFKFVLHSGHSSGNDPTAKIFCSQCSTQIMSAFSDILLGIFYLKDANNYTLLKFFSVLMAEMPEMFQRQL